MKYASFQRFLRYPLHFIRLYFFRFFFCSIRSQRQQSSFQLDFVLRVEWPERSLLRVLRRYPAAPYRNFGIAARPAPPVFLALR